MTNPPNHPTVPPPDDEIVINTLPPPSKLTARVRELWLHQTCAERAADAFRRGAEAMRGKCVAVCVDNGFHDAVESIRTAIRSLPLPEPGDGAP